MFEIKNKLGDIRFSRNVIKRIAADAVKTCDGDAYILNFKGKYKSALPEFASKMNLYGHEHIDPGSITAVETPEGVDICIYIVAKFGVSLSKTAEKILDYMYENVQKVMSEEPHQVKVVVTGVESRDIARRNIEFVR